MKFQKGNKLGRGRPKLDDKQREARKIAKELAGEAMDRLASWMRSDNPKASVQASVAIIDRAEGKPAQTIRNDEDGKPFKVEQITRVIVDKAQN